MREDRLSSAGIDTVADLVLTLPLRYDDRRVVRPITSLDGSSGRVLVRGRFSDLSQRTVSRRRGQLVEGRLSDETGTIRAVWFNARWIAETLQNESVVALFGKVHHSRRNELEIVNPVIEQPDGETGLLGRLVPVYPALGGLDGRLVRRLVRGALSGLQGLPDPLSPETRRSHRLPEIADVLREAHDPPSNLGDAAVEAMAVQESHAHRRLVFDEMLAFVLGLRRRREERNQTAGPLCRIDDSLRETAMELLPFVLTGAQKRVMREIADDLTGDAPMARLVQGDVGSGKTIVAGLAALIVATNGRQVAMMAPTQLLAEQHQKGLAAIFKDTPFAPELLSGSTAVKDRRRIVRGLEDGRVRLLIGTHALIQDALEYKELGLVIVDEQHRFGVAHRQALLDKGNAPHLLVMTATPIPRSLALILYGDLDLSIIDELPPGRTPVRTELRSEGDREKIYQFINTEVIAGGRVYVVYPIIDESEAIDADALNARIDEVTSALGNANVGVLHGRMSREEQEKALADFRSGEIQVLLATTVVEVGVDVPEATVMMIESSERFGLSQLHQLRGRVGRGRRRSWCVCLVGDNASAAARKRLSLFARTGDGFKLAEADLKMRGTGEMLGTQQWGPSGFRFVNPIRHHDIVKKAWDCAREVEEKGLGDTAREGLARYHQTEFEVPTG